MEINEALDAIQTLVHCQGISREIEALETIRATLAVVQNSSHNTTKVDITKGEYQTVCCGITIGSVYEFCPKCGTNLW